MPKNNLLTIGLDTKKSKTLISQQLTELTKQLSSSSSLKTVARLDIAASRKNIQVQLKEISKSLSLDIKFNIKLNDVEKQTRQASDTVSKSISESLKNDTLVTNIKSQQQALLNLNKYYRGFVDNPALAAKWQELFNTSSIISSQEELTNLRSHVVLFKREVDTSGNVINNVATTATANMIALRIAMELLNVVINAFTTGIRNIESLDSTLVELNRVADVTPKRLEAIADKAYELSDAVGKTGIDVLQATQQFRQAGYTLEESMDIMAKAALTGTIVSEDVKDASQIASTIISILKGTKKDATEAMSIINILNEVSNNSAIGFDALSTGLERVAGTIHQTGTSLEQMTGLLTGAYTTLRNMESSSTGLLTISQRLRGVTEDGENATEFIAKLQDAFTNLRDSSGNIVDSIKIMDNGELRSTYAILEDMAEILPQVSSAQRQYITELAAGKPRVAVLNAILDNWNEVEAATKQALNSFGSAEKEAEIWRSSIEGIKTEIASLQQELSRNVIDDDTIKSVLSVFRELLKVLVALTSNKAAMSFLTKGFVAFFGVKTIQNGAKIVDVFKQLRSATQALAQRYLSLGTASNTAAAGQAAVGASGQAAATGITSMNTAATLGISAIFALGTILIQYLAQSQERARQAAEESRQAYETLTSEIESVSSELETANARMAELQAKGHLTFVENEELLKLKETTAELEMQLGIMQEQEKIAAKTAIKDTTKVFNQDFGGTESADSYRMMLYSGVDSQFNNVSGKPTWLLQDEKNINALIVAYEYFSEVKREALEAGDIELADSFENDLITIRQLLSDNYDIIQDSRETYELVDFDELLSGQKEAYTELLAYQQAITETLSPGKWLDMNFNEVWGNDVFADLKQQLIDLAEAGKLTQDTLNEADYSDMMAEFERLGISTDKVYEQLMALYEIGELTSPSLNIDLDVSTALKEFSAEIESLYSKFDILNDALVELGENNKLTAETFKALTDNNLLQYIDFTTMSLNEQGEAFFNSELAVKNTAKAQLQLALQTTLAAIATSGYTDAQWYAKRSSEAASETADSFATALNNVSGQALTAAMAVDIYNKSVLNEGGPGLDLAKQGAQIEEAVKQFNSASAVFDAVSYSYDKMGNSAGRAAKQVDELTESLKRQKTELENQKSIYESALRAINKLLDKEKKSLQDNNDLLKERSDLLGGQLSSINSSINYTIDQEIKALQDEIDALKDAADANKELLAVEKAREEYERARLQKTARVYTEKSGWTWMQDEKSVEDARNSLDSAERDYAESEIQKQIDELEKYKQSFADFIKEYEMGSDLKVAIDILGADWEKALLTDREAFFEMFKNHYLNTQSEINDLTDEIEANEARIKMLDEIKAKWAEVSSAYQDEQDRYNAALLLGANWEQDVLSGRIDVWENFKNDFVSIQKQIEEVARKIEEAAKKAEEAAARAAAAGTGVGGGSNYKVVDGNGNTLKDGFASLGAAQSYADSIMRSSLFRGTASVQRYARGSKKIPYDQLAITDELGEELIIKRPNGGNLRLLQKGDSVLPADLTERIFDMAKNYNPLTNRINELQKTIINNINTINNNQVTNYNYNVGTQNINEVEHACSLANSIKTQFSSAMMQATRRS